MFDVVVYLLDDKYREEISEIFSSPGYQLHMAVKLPEVLNFCRCELIDLIIVWQGDVQTVSALFQHLENHQLKHLPVIVVVRNADDFHSVSALPVAGIIPIPLPKVEFYRLLYQVLDPLRKASGLTEIPVTDGTYLDSSFIEAIRRIQAAQANALLSVTDRGHIGQVYFRQGRIVRASFRALEGIAALKKLAGLIQAEVKIHFTEVKDEGDLETENPHLLADVENQLTEQRKMIRLLSASREHYHTNPNLKSLDYPKNEIASQILELCREGSDLPDLLAVLNQDNLEILRTVQELSTKEALLTGKELPASVVTHQPGRKSLVQMINSLSGIFKKSKKSSKGKTSVTQDKKTDIAEPLPPAVKASSSKITTDIDLESEMKIEKFIREIYS
jgi:hypothetical protein